MKLLGEVCEKIVVWAMCKGERKVVEYSIVLMAVVFGIFFGIYIYTYQIDKTPYTDDDIQPLYTAQEYIFKGGELEGLDSKPGLSEVKFEKINKNDTYTIMTKNKQVKLTREYDYKNQQKGIDKIEDSCEVFNVFIVPPVLGLAFATFVYCVLYAIYYVIKFFIWIITIIVRMFRNKKQKRKYKK